MTGGASLLAKCAFSTWKASHIIYYVVLDFDHETERLFQVSDMLTYIDKYDYKYKNKMLITRIEKYFFNEEEMRKILKKLDKKRFL